MLNNRLFQKIKLIGNELFNHLVNILKTITLVWVKTLI
jgi:hypothetical protein